MLAPLLLLISNKIELAGYCCPLTVVIDLSELIVKYEESEESWV